MTVDGYFARAVKYLDSADVLLAHGDYESSVSRSYYAMFFAAEAALLARGLSYATHRGVAAAFGEQFVKNGPLPRSLARDFTRALEKRLLSDYGEGFALSRDEAAELLAQARAFVAAVRSATA